MADFLSQTRSDIDKRLQELRPLHDEYLTLQKAKQALDGVSTPRRSPGRPRGSSGTRRRRRRSGGTLAEQAVKLVKENPGITVGDMAPHLSVKHKNYLYRVMAGLQEEGRVRKEGRGFHAT